MSTELSSNISSNVFFTGIGNSGNININTQNLSLSSNGSIDTEIFGQGNAGNIDITAKAITIDGGGNQNLFPSDISSEAFSDLTDSPFAEAN